MSTVLKVKAKRRLKADGEQYAPGDEFPFDPENRNHYLLLQNRAIQMLPADEEPAVDVDALLDVIDGVEGVGPATLEKVKEALDGYFS